MAYVATRRALLGGGQRKWPPADWWTVAGQTCVAAYQPIGAPSLAASYVNLAAPGTYDAAPGVAPSFDAATGWTFDGVRQYLETGIAAANGWCMLVRFSDATLNSNGILAGARTPSGQRFYLMPRDNSSTYHTYGYNGTNSVAGLLSSGIMAIAGSSGGFLNGTKERNLGTLTETTTNLSLGAESQTSGAPGNNFNGKIQAIAIYSTTLSASDVAALTARMQAL